MADSSCYGYGTPFDSKEQAEQRQKRMKEETERMKNLMGSCSVYDRAYTCASINKDVCMPSSVSFSNSRSQKETMFDQLAKENKKLTQEKIKLNLKVLELQKQLKEAIDDKNKYKAFAEAEKDKFWKDLKNGFANLNKSIKSIYQKIIDWFNS